MARKKLFGNARDPRCETCLHGRRSSDGDAILCRRGGVLPLSHHCRHFRYDPLRRTPNRVRPLEEFDAAEFALDDLSAEWFETVAQEGPSPEDVRHSELMEKLRAYLNETPSPNVDDILLLLNETPVTPTDTEALLAEADLLQTKPACEKSSSAPSSAVAPTTTSTAATETPSTEVALEIEATPEIEELSAIEETAEIEETVETDAVPEIDTSFEIEEMSVIGEMPVAAVPQAIETVLENDPTAETEGVLAKIQAEPLPLEEAAATKENDRATPASFTWHSDSSLDITGDLERLTVDVVQSSTPAAFRYFDLKFDEGDQPMEERDDIQIEGNDAFSEDALLTTPQGSDYDEEALRAEDLIFLSEMQLMEEDDNAIGMNADGTFIQFKEH